MPKLNTIKTRLFSWPYELIHNCIDRMLGQSQRVLLLRPCHAQAAYDLWEKETGGEDEANHDLAAAARARSNVEFLVVEIKSKEVCCSLFCVCV